MKSLQKFASVHGSSERMDEETRKQVITLLTRIGMIAEDLSAIALGRQSSPARSLMA